jgi:hypothetical protein
MESILCAAQFLDELLVSCGLAYVRGHGSVYAAADWCWLQPSLPRPRPHARSLSPVVSRAMLSADAVREDGLNSADATRQIFDHALSDGLAIGM